MRLLSFFLFFSSLLFTQNEFTVNQILISGNKTTKNFIILRELPFSKNSKVDLKDTTKLKDLAIQNLENTNLFNQVFLSFHENKLSSTVNVKVNLQERWYLWPNPKFEIMERNVRTWWRNGRNLDRANYGLFVSHLNFRGRRETLRLKVKLGYVQTLGFDYNNPFLSKKGKWGLRLSYHYLTRHEVPVTSENAKWLFYKNEEQQVRAEHQSFAQLYYRPQFFLQHKWTFNHRSVSIIDEIQNNYHFYLNNGLVQSQYFSLKYELRWDKRNDKDFPTKGLYLESSIEKLGLGISDKSVNHLFLISEWKQFFQLKSKLFFAYGARFALSNQNEIATYVEPILGRRELPRAYDNYLIHGQSYGVVRTHLRYQLINRDDIRLPKIPEKFNHVPIKAFVGIHGDIGYVNDFMNYRENGLNNQVLYSAGMSLESVSFYDLVLRLEYSMNHLLESGLFIHFTAPI
jgi:outer membrane protein assembly factor BamA